MGHSVILGCPKTNGRQDGGLCTKRNSLNCARGVSCKAHPDQIPQARTHWSKLWSNDIGNSCAIATNPTR